MTSSSPSPSMLEERWANDLQAPRRARRALTDFAAHRLDDDMLATALLLTTEVVTNAVQHTSGPLRLRAHLGPVALVVEVEDFSEDGIRFAPPDDAAECGRGLQIIEALATRWGTERTHLGKLVWFEIPLRDRTHHPSA
jgi:anti-sigma regulatory factor (Ser/Thr protein kinase)